MPIKRSPQEKKELSLERDRRETYGANRKSSRKNVPLAKKLGNRASRHRAESVLNVAIGPFDESRADAVGFAATGAYLDGKQKRFRKVPAKPLGNVLKYKAESTSGSFKAFGTPVAHRNGK